MPVQRRNTDLTDLAQADLDWGPFHPRTWATNKSGGALALGDLVAISNTTDQQVVTTTTQAHGVRLAGIIVAGGVDGAIVWLRTSGTFYVRMDAGGCAHGDQLALSTITAGAAQTAAAGDFVFGVAVEDQVGAGLVKCIFSTPVATGAGGINLPHNVLSATHGDSTAAAVVLGDVIVGLAGPTWQRYGLVVPAAPTINFFGVANGETVPTWKSASSNPGAAAAVLQTNAAGYVQVVSAGIGAAPWAGSVVAMADGGIIGCDAISPQITFDNTNDELELHVTSGSWTLRGNATSPNLIGGYSGNTIGAGATQCAILSGGRAGQLNTISTNSERSVIIGGEVNLLDSQYTVVFGRNNVTEDDVNISDCAIIGFTNLIHKVAAGNTPHEVFLFGNSITVDRAAHVFVGATENSTIGNNCDFATMFGLDNAIDGGQFCVTIGDRAHAHHAGAFVWGSGPIGAAFNSIASGEFAIRARGGFRHAYDDANYWTAQVTAAGAVTFNATGASAGFTFSDPVTVPAAGLIYTGMARGDLLAGNATPAFARLALGGIAGSVLTRDATDALWSTFGFVGTAGQIYTFPAVGGGVTLGAGTLTVATANDATIANHTHAITSSSNPGAAASILASSAAGLLQLTGLGIGVAGTANNLVLLATTSSITGVIYKGANSFIHNFTPAGSDGRNVFCGIGSGNFTMATGGGGSYLCSWNTGIGNLTLPALTKGYYNCAMGTGSLQACTTGAYNIGNGTQTMSNITDGYACVAIGGAALYTGIHNQYCIAIGHQSGFYETGNYKLFIDYDSRTSEAIARETSFLYGDMAAGGRLQLNIGTPTTGAVKESLRLQAYVSTAATGGAADFGPALTLWAETATDGTYQQQAQIAAAWAVATAGASSSPLLRFTTYPANAAGPGYSGHWTWSGVDGTARTVIPNGTGDVTEVATFLYAVSAVTAGDAMGGTVVLEPSDSFELYDDGTDALTLAVAADGSVTVQRTAGADTFKVSLWGTWL